MPSIDNPQRNLFEALCDQADAGICAVSSRAEIIYANAECCRLFDVGDELPRGTPLHRLLPSSAAACQAWVMRALEEPVRLRHAIRAADGDAWHVDSVLKRARLATDTYTVMLTSVEARTADNAAFSPPHELDNRGVLLESVTDAIMSFDSQWRYTYLNAAAERFLKRPRAELLGRTCWDIFPQLAAHENSLKTREVMTNRTPVAWESFSSIAGSWSQWHAYPTADGGISVFVVDVDRRVRALQALHESESRFRALSDLVPAFIWTTDADGTLEWASQAWSLYSGRSGSELPLHQQMHFVHPDDRANADRWIRYALETGTNMHFELRLGAADGSYRWFLVRARPLVDHSGKPTQWVGATIDIQAQRTALSTEQQARADAELARSAAEDAQEHLRTILAAIPTAIAVTYGPEHTFRMINRAYEELVSGRAVLGRPVRDVFPEVGAHGFIEILERVYATGEPTVLRERQVAYDRLQNGQEYEGYFTSFLAPLRARDGTITGVVTSAMEVTDLVQQRVRIQSLVDEAEAGRRLLEQAHAELETRIQERTAELARSNAALANEIAVRGRAEAARGELLRRLATAREEEQRRTARDLHDQVGQTLSALMLAIKTACDAEVLPDAAAARLQDALRLAEALGQEIHDLATQLRPIILDDIGLHAALRQLIGTWSRRYSVSVDLQADWLQRQRLPPDVETVLYRVVQEALTNVARHARARHVSVVVERHAGQAIAIVEDDGVGFDLNAYTPDRLGLVGMTERVSQVGGTLEIETGPVGGVTLIARVPVTEAGES